MGGADSRRWHGWLISSVALRRALRLNLGSPSLDCKGLIFTPEKIGVNLRRKSGNCFSHRFAQMNTDSKSAEHVNHRASLRSYARQAEAESKAETAHLPQKGAKDAKNEPLICADLR